MRDPDCNVIELLLWIVRPKQIRAERETQAITDAMATFRDKAKYSARFMFQAEGPYLVEDKEQYYMSRLRSRGIQYQRILPRQPAQTVSKSPSTSFVQRCEHLAIAMREAEKLGQRLRVDVRVYGGERLVKTIKLSA